MVDPRYSNPPGTMMISESLESSKVPKTWPSAVSILFAARSKSTTVNDGLKVQRASSWLALIKFPKRCGGGVAPLRHFRNNSQDAHEPIYRAFWQRASMTHEAVKRLEWQWTDK